YPRPRNLASAGNVFDGADGGGSVFRNLGRDAATLTSHRCLPAQVAKHASTAISAINHIASGRQISWPRVAKSESDRPVEKISGCKLPHSVRSSSTGIGVRSLSRTSGLTANKSVAGPPGSACQFNRYRPGRRVSLCIRDLLGD